MPNYPQPKSMSERLQTLKSFAGRNSILELVAIVDDFEKRLSNLEAAIARENARRCRQEQDTNILTDVSA